MTAIAAARAARAIGRAAGSGGSALPGLVAERLRPGILGELGAQLPEGAVFVTGTNGKTTTCRFLSAMLRASGKRVVTNEDGSNLSRGIAISLVRASDLRGRRPPGDVGVFEVDEGALPNVVRQLPPKALVVTNLFRDQLDRYGEIDTLASRIGEAVSGLYDTTLLLDADDPKVATIVEFAAYFGLEDAKVRSEASTRAADSVRCHVCGGELEYDSRYFAHLGRWHCPTCGRTRPVPWFSLEDVGLGLDSSSATFEEPNGETGLELPLPGLYNLYNALAAASAASFLGVDDGTIARTVQEACAAFGRMERVTIGDHELFLLLVKNPTGFSQAAETLARDGEPKRLLLALNDNLADGTDTSWVWDAEVELLGGIAEDVVVSGTRAEEMALRLKYAGLPPSALHVEPDLVRAVRLGLDTMPPGHRLYVLPTYTAMTGIRAALARGGHVREKLA
jgi:UDP-N-acetylmuramyl tripeptide synthase